jgi:predicted ATPase/class 3 adenylate cyclase
MNELAALLLTDIVDSTAIANRLGDEAATALWSAHDRAARDLLHLWRGQEIDKSDGFLILFQQPRDALGYVLDYHRALATLPVPLQARAGLHVGQVSMRQTPAADVARGAKPIEVDGVSKPIAARVMSAALGGQTLVTAAAVAALGPVAQRVLGHGHWRVKGLPDPLELFEIGEAGAPFTPPPDTDKVYRVVQQQVQGEALWLPLREVPHTLPAERDAFVGRRATLAALAGHYNAGARLVSLLGIGGGGKTRLALRYGWLRLGDYPGGVWFCELAGARTVEGLVSAVAQGLGVPLGKDDPVQQVGHAIAGRGACLVVLDNFEHLARHAETTLGQWLERAADARFLVTTREVLGIGGEVAVTLAPLPIEDAQALFMRRAAAAKRDFAPTADDIAAIPALVKLLDGLPLAIELAAARARMLSPRALLARMSERFKLLSSSGRRQDRQATLRAAFDWSWDLLPPADKAALAQLSVFEGGFTLEAAEGVLELAGNGDGNDTPWTMDVVQSLVDKSFVRALEGDRFDLLGSVQEYAAEHLRSEGRYSGSGPAAMQAAFTRHGQWFAALGPVRAVQTACIELDNLVTACRRAVAAAEPGAAAGTLEGAWAALALQGPFQAGVELASAVCALPGLSDAEAAQAHTCLGAALAAVGQREAALASYDRAVAHARSAGDPHREAAARVGQGSLQARNGQAQLAEQTLAQALQLAQRLNDASLQCAAMSGLGTLAFNQERLPEAQPHYAAALQLARSRGERNWQAVLLGNLGNLRASLGELDAALALSSEALLIARELGDRQREGNTLSNLGLLHQLLGQQGAAREASAAALVIARELGHLRLECIVLCNLGIIAQAAGDSEEALEKFESALPAARQIGDRHTEAQALGYLGLVLARRRSFEFARTLFEQSQHILQALAQPLSQALLLCHRAECEWLAGQPELALAAQAQAQALADQAGARPTSELGLALAQLGEKLGAASA